VVELGMIIFILAFWMTANDTLYSLIR